MNPTELQQSIDIIKKELLPVAEKIGQTAEWTYGLFLKQVYVNAFVNCLWIPVGIACLIACYKIWKKCSSFDLVDRVPFVLFSLILLVFSLVAILLPVAGLIQAFMNPDYAAIQLIIGTFKQ